jgi:hypothetical protein
VLKSKPVCSMMGRFDSSRNVGWDVLRQPKLLILFEALLIKILRSTTPRNETIRYFNASFESINSTIHT